MTIALVLEQARATLGAAAFLYNDHPYSYGWLARAVSSQTAAFRGCGLHGPGITVVAMRRWPDAMVAMFALRVLGRTVLPLSSVDLLRAMKLRDLRDVVTSSREVWPGLDTACRERSFALHTVVPSAGDTGDAGVALELGREGGQIVQTSGTTGLPKFVLYEPSFEAAFIRDWAADRALSADCVFGIADFPPWTAVGHRGPLACWLGGGTLVVAQQRPLIELFRRPNLTHALVTPSMLRELLAAPPDTLAFNPGLRLGIVGATAARDQVAEAKRRLTPRVEARIGTTETRNVAITPQDEVEDFVWHCPAPGATVSCADGDGRPVAIGTVGRLRIVTAGGPDGYLDDPDTTAAFFQDGFFYTGDLAVFRDDGRFALRGRATDIINIGGHKIAPAPIEQRLCDAFALRGVCLLTVPSPDGDEELVVVIESDGSVDTAAFGAALRQELASFPQARLFYIARLPRNALGKLMREEVRALVEAARLKALSRPPSLPDSIS